MPSAMSRSKAVSSAVRGLSSEKVFTLSTICSMLLMPLRTIFTLGKACRNRKPQEAMESSGCRAFSFASSASL